MVAATGAGPEWVIKEKGKKGKLYAVCSMQYAVVAVNLRSELYFQALSCDDLNLSAAPGGFSEATSLAAVREGSNK